MPSKPCCIHGTATVQSGFPEFELNVKPPGVEVLFAALPGDGSTRGVLRPCLVAGCMGRGPSDAPKLQRCSQDILRNGYDGMAAVANFSTEVG